MKIIMKIAVLCMGTILITLSGCTKRIYIPAETIVERTDTMFRNLMTRDSIIIRDSVVIDRTGDTIRIERWSDRWRNSVSRSDSVRIIRDSIRIEKPYPVEIIKEIPKGLSRWQKTLQALGILSILLLLTFAIYKIRGRNVLR